MADPVQIDPATGERIQSSAPQIDPATGERMAASPPAAPPPQEGFWESLGHTFGIGKEEATAQLKQAQEHPLVTALKAAIPGAEAVQGAYQGGKRIVGELGQAASELKQGEPGQAAIHAVNAVPFLGPAIQHGAEQLGPGESINPAELGTALGTAVQTAPMVLGALDKIPGRPTIPNPPVGELAKRVRQYVNPTSSPSIVPRAEFAARSLADAVIPAGQDAPNFIKSAQQEVPNILDYAKRTGNPLNTQLEFSKAAQGYAQEVRDLYEKSVLGPSENKLVRTTGTGFGRRMNEGPETQATLGEIDKRVTNINQQLDKPALNSDDARRALATKTELQNEASGLRKILHKNLSDASGLDPEEIANLRQRVGRSYELANDTDAAVTKRMLAAGKSDQGPLHLSQLPTGILNKISGGVVSNSDRAFQSAIKNFPGESQPLPSVSPQPATLTMPSNLENLLSAIRQRQVKGRQGLFTGAMDNAIGEEINRIRNLPQ